MQSLHLNTPEQLMNKENISPNKTECSKVINVTNLLKSQKLETEDVLSYSVESVKYLKNSKNPLENLDYSPFKTEHVRQ